MWLLKGYRFIWGGGGENFLKLGSGSVNYNILKITENHCIDIPKREFDAMRIFLH